MHARTQFAWSVRREIWEHRSIWIAPIAAAALMMVAFAVAADPWSGAMRSLATMPVDRHWMLTIAPYGLVTWMVMLWGWVVAATYSLDALNAERRDRTILFWKSMPVSDVVAVLAKAAIPLVVVPAIATVVALVSQVLVIGEAAAILAFKGLPPSYAWSTQPWAAMSVAVVYGAAAQSLWYAPIAGYLLLVSAAARRSPWLWAVLPPLAAVAFEFAAFGTLHVANLLKHRLVGGLAAFRTDTADKPILELTQLDPIGFLSTPGLWLGLAFAAACIAVAIRLRRYREPT